MKRIETSDGLFQPGDPTIRKPGTIVPAWWLNAIQEELVAVIEEAGIKLDGDKNDQLLEAIKKLMPEIPKYKYGSIKGDDKYTSGGGRTDGDHVLTLTAAAIASLKAGDDALKGLNGLGSAAKKNTGDFAAASHSHSGYASSTHKHNAQDINGLEGMGTRLYDRTGQRAANTTYYNTTGKFITVYITSRLGENASCQALLNGSVVLTIGGGDWHDYNPVVLLVPPGGNYLYSGSFLRWMELSV